jgi:phage replication O-like protein O
MSSGIQVENGNFARIHNDISERLAHTDLNGSEFRCLWFLLRKTYGFQKKEDDISYSQFSEGTKLDRRNVMRSLEKMVQRCIIYRRENGNNRPQTWGFNKYFEQWDQTSGESTTASSVESTAILAETGGQSTPSGGGESTTRIAQTSGQICTSSGESTTTSSGESTTTSSGELTTHKRYKDIDKDKTKDNSAAPSLGDPLVDAANRKWQMGQKGVRSAGWQAELNLELEPALRVPLANRLAEIWKMVDSINSGNDKANHECHRVASRLYKQGVKSVDALNVHYRAYLADDWRKKNHPNPRPEKMEEFINKSKPDETVPTKLPVGVSGNLGFSLASI